MLGVMTDNPDPASLLNFESDHELLYPVVRVDRDIMSAFRYPDAIPTTFVYDPTGHLRASHRGPMSASALSAVLDQILAERLAPARSRLQQRLELGGGREQAEDAAGVDEDDALAEAGPVAAPAR